MDTDSATSSSREFDVEVVGIIDSAEDSSTKLSLDEEDLGDKRKLKHACSTPKSLTTKKEKAQRGQCCAAVVALQPPPKSPATRKAEQVVAK
ncbi:hypothetical protein HPB50_015637 [Hyalomma asiaticum]|uniref:Uncharacterized protein n=1 Tax=Hyalomma asiaticum TaxID=266040 RepID=A0ACB7TL31_HYAAI|nr:hypothetical protein HPB50_015637 [Hyalomma asiaticum]